VINAAIIGLGWWGKNIVSAVQGKSDKIRFVHGVSQEPGGVRDFAKEKGFKVVSTAEAVKQAVGLGITGADVAIAYNDSDPTAPNLCATAPFGLGCVVTVTVTYSYTAATPVIGQIVGTIPLTATTEMPLERTCPDPPGLATCP